MAERTRTIVTTPSFVADPNSLQRGGGVTIDWDKVAEQDGRKVVKAGTLMTDGDMGAYPAAADASTATFILTTTASKDSKTDALTGYGDLRGGVVYKNLLPESSEADFETRIDALSHFTFLTYRDQRGV